MAKGDSLNKNETTTKIASENGMVTAIRLMETWVIPKLLLTSAAQLVRCSKKRQRRPEIPRRIYVQCVPEGEKKRVKV